MRSTLFLAATACLFLCGCASEKPQAKKIYERPWIGGSFESVRTPPSIRTNNAQRFGKHGALITRVNSDTPLAKAGLQEGDLIIAVNGKNVRYDHDIRRISDMTNATPLTLTIYRDGAIAEKTVTPGVERYEKLHSISFVLSLSTHFDIDIFPNPDFSLIALGYNHKNDRINLTDPKSTYQRKLRETEGKPPEQNGWHGLPSDEGWRAWLGPFLLAQNKMIISQEPGR